MVVVWLMIMIEDFLLYSYVGMTYFVSLAKQFLIAPALKGEVDSKNLFFEDGGVFLAQYGLLQYDR